jgi:hypothetical protein
LLLAWGLSRTATAATTAGTGARMLRRHIICASAGAEAAGGVVVAPAALRLWQLLQCAASSRGAAGMCASMKPQMFGVKVC